MKPLIARSLSLADTKEEPEPEPPGILFPTLNSKRVTFPSLQKNFPVSPHIPSFVREHFPLATESQWNNWQWQIRNSFTSFRQLETFLELSENEVKPSREDRQLPVRITPYYASLLNRNDPGNALRKTMVPVFDELIVSPAEKTDPLGEISHSPLPNLVHRYPDRVLFLVTGFCAAYCRYCTRSHMVSKKDKCHSSRMEWDAAIDYIKDHSEVRDVLLSGGDPLTLPDFKLEYLLSRLRAIPHVEIIRIGTKVPVVLPQRITKSLVNMLRKYHPFFMSIHFTHPDEITPECSYACTTLADAGIPLGSQTVLLKGVNDDVDVFKKLNQSLLKIRVRPYYLYQLDPIPGSAHFKVPVSKGLEIIRGLRGFTSGYAVPHYVIDAPGGGGKIPLLPDYVVASTPDGYILENFEEKRFFYPERNLDLLS
jgi:lysine 2,3-aminomutase